MGSRPWPTCNDGRLSLKLGKFGAFAGCSNYPECRYTRRLNGDGAQNGDGADEGPRALGDDPESGLPVSLRKGPYGDYVQLGILPLGTGGDFPRSLGDRPRLAEGIRRLAEGETRRIDAGRVSYLDRDSQQLTGYFVNVASLGISGLRYSFVWGSGGVTFCNEYRLVVSLKTKTDAIDLLRRYPKYIEKITGMPYDDFVAAYVRDSPETDELLLRFVRQVTDVA